MPSFDSVYESDKEATLAKALLEIAGECHAGSAPEWANMTLDEVYGRDRARGTVLPKKDPTKP